MEQTPSNEITPPPASAPEQVEEVSTAPDVFILPPPAGPETAAVEPAAPIELPPMPESIATALEEQRLAAAEQHAAYEASVAEAARHIIETEPGYDPNAPAPVAVEAPVTDGPTVISVDGGKFGNGIIETPMPPDPTRVPGWNGQIPS